MNDNQLPVRQRIKLLNNDEVREIYDAAARDEESTPMEVKFAFVCVFAMLAIGLIMCLVLRAG